MSSMAIILVSAQISPNHYQISAHHGSAAGERRANATFQDLIPIAKQIGIKVVHPTPIVSQL